MKSENCMYCMPHELTGIGKCCALFQDICNDKGSRCIGFAKHTKESRQALSEAIEIKNEKLKELLER